MGFEGADALHYRYADGITVWRDKKNPDNGHAIRFVGTMGEVFVDRGKVDASPKELLRHVDGPNDVQVYESKEYRANFIESIVTRKPMICPATVGRRTGTICPSETTLDLFESFRSSRSPLSVEVLAAKKRRQLKAGGPGMAPSSFVLRYSGLGRFLCEPSQSGGFAVCLHWHHQMVFFSATSYCTGCRPVPLCEPSQNGGWLERPQEHHQ
jgi:hypothetical protein